MARSICAGRDGLACTIFNRRPCNPARRQTGTKFCCKAAPKIDDRTWVPRFLTTNFVAYGMPKPRALVNGRFIPGRVHQSGSRLVFPQTPFFEDPGGMLCDCC